MSQPFSILVVDANRQQADALADFLIDRGCRVESCADGRGALRALERGELVGAPFDLIIAGQDLPGMSGLQLLAAVRDRNPSLPFILSSPFATVDPGLAPKAERLGAAQVIGSPVEHAQIACLLRDLTWSRSHKAGKPPEPADATPFFGTARVADAHEISGRSPALPSSGRFTGGTARMTDTGRPGHTLGRKPHTTARVRRSLTQSITKQQAQDAPQQDPPLPTALPVVPERMVACAQCAQAFMVPVKPDAFTVLCIHCGQPNRILPE